MLQPDIGELMSNKITTGMGQILFKLCLSVSISTKQRK